MPKGQGYFRGLANRQRVKAWQRAHPGYWRKRRQKSRALHYGHKIRLDLGLRGSLPVGERCGYGGSDQGDGRGGGP